MFPTTPRRISRYEIIDRLGEGGMGVLYLARDPLLDRRVAIKVLSVLNHDLRERFAREARSVAALKHQHIVTIFDIGEEQGYPFIAMEYVDGETLADVIRGRSALGLLRKVDLMLELCSGLGHAHHAGIVHRDIKPANLMVTTTGVLKILDFGLARSNTDATAAGLTRAGFIIGTPNYMSPEQIEGLAVDCRSDIFAVGLVLYELLTFHKAYAGDSAHSVMHKIMTAEPTPIRDIVHGIDLDFERVVARAIKKAPAHRYQRLSEMAEDLTRARDRLTQVTNAPTVRLDGGFHREEGSGSRASTRLGTPTPTPRKGPHLDDLARRRSAQIDARLNEAAGHLAAGRADAAIEQCEQALVLDPQHSGALALLEQAHRVLDDRQLDEWLEAVKHHLATNALSAAGVLLDQALQLRPDSPDGQQLRRVLLGRQQEQERARERARASRAALDRAGASLRAQAFGEALRAANEVLTHDPSNPEGIEIKQHASQALETQRQQEARDRFALDAVATAKRRAATGDVDGALEGLRAVTPPHAQVDRAIAELENERSIRRRQEAEARERLAREESRLRHDARIAHDLAQAKLRDAEEQRRREESEEETRRIQGVAQANRDPDRRAIQPLEPQGPEPLAVLVGVPDALEGGSPVTPVAEAPLVPNTVHQAAVDLMDEVDAAIEDRRQYQAPRAVGGIVRVGQPAHSRDLPVASTPLTWPLKGIQRFGMVTVAVALMAILIAGAGVYEFWARPGRVVDSGDSGKGTTVEQLPGIAQPVLLAVDLQPWARVRIVGQDGQTAPAEVFVTPFTVALPPGRYVLKCENAGLTPPVEFQVEMKAGVPQTVSRLMEGFDPDGVVTTLIGKTK